MLIRPFSIVLTESAARQYFNTTDILGKHLETNKGEVYQITGVVEDPPGNSHIQFDFLASYQTLKPVDQAWQRWAYTYVLLPAGDIAVNSLQEKLTILTSQDGDELAQSLGFWFRDMNFGLQPLTRIHLHSQLQDEIVPTGDIRYIYLYSAIAIFILLIAVVNYVNLATARSISRMKEVGIRKAIGAQSKQLMTQSFTEVILYASIALIAALLFIYLVLPIYQNATGKFHIAQWTGRPEFIGLLGFLAFSTTIFSGIYPALILSRFNPTQVIKSNSSPESIGNAIRNILIIGQFTIALVLIVATLTMRHQLQYIQQKRLGFDKEYIITLPIKGDLVEKYYSFQHELNQVAGVEHLSIAIGPPNNGMTSTVQIDEQTFLVQELTVSAEYVQTMGLEIIQGRDFSSEIASDSSGLIINETAAQIFNLENKIGQRIDSKYTLGAEDLVLLGIVKDFHNTSFYEPILPSFIQIGYKQFWDKILIRLRPGQLQPIIAQIGDIWKSFVPDHPFEYSFLEENLEAQYRNEGGTASVINSFALLAIFLACMGLFGLSAYESQKRTKEIGVRKVMGAKVSDILLLLSSDFLRLILIAAGMAFPLSYIFLNRWLQQFAYHVNIGPDIFLISGGGVFFIALLSVSFQAIKAALTDPVETLRYE
ncbi:MAG: FtsX-like permease family protein [Candidatus Marinimicrobia bacterium]|nr:FtsX-like permease family protein [Candidatus Neomarinimicrobiota bacterium]